MKVADINRPPEDCPDCLSRSEWDGTTSPAGHPIAWCRTCGNKWPADNQKPPLPAPSTGEPPLHPQRKWKQWYKKQGNPGWEANTEWRRRMGIVLIDRNGMPVGRIG